MSKKIRGEGADGFFLKTLTECIGRLGAIHPDKAAALRELYHAEIARNPAAAEYPKEYMRHEGAILARLFSTDKVVIQPPQPVIKDDIVIPTEASGLDDIGLTEFDIEPDPVNPYTVSGGPLAKVLDEWATARTHPFVRTIEIPTASGSPIPGTPGHHVKVQKYTVVGTAVVNYPNGTSVNINATTGNFRKIRECDETVLTHFNGRPVSMQKETTPGTVFFVWLCHYSPGRVFRFWMNRNENGTRKDDPRGAIRVLVIDHGTGWRKVAA